MSDVGIPRPTPVGAGDSLLSLLPPGTDDRLLAIILTNMFGGVVMLRPADTTVLYASPRFAAMFGFAPGELEGKPVTTLFATDAPPPDEVTRDMVNCVRTTGHWNREIENIRKDGSRFWGETNLTVFEHPKYGTVWVAVHRDITARKRAEAELRRSEERLGLVLEATGSGAWDWNLSTGEVYFSPYWTASLGYAQDDVSPTAAFWESLIHPADMPRVREALARHWAGQTPMYECVNRLRRKDGTWRWNLDRGRVVEWTPTGEPLRMVGTDTDLSQQRWSGLREIIPICAGCKMIREESGRWRALEIHFGEHSLASFSHGLCPACLSKYSQSQSPPAPEAGQSSE